MNFPYEVHAVSDGTAAVTVDIAGEQVPATVATLVVEFVATEPSQGTFTRRFVGAAAAAAKAAFPPGQIVQISVA